MFVFLCRKYADLQREAEVGDIEALHQNGEEVVVDLHPEGNNCYFATDFLDITVTKLACYHASFYADNYFE